MARDVLTAISEPQAAETEAVARPASFYAPLEKIRKRPGLFLGRKSLDAFVWWHAGYAYGKFDAGAAPSAEEEEFHAFDEFVCRKYDWHDSGGWAGKIRYYHKDDAAAFDRFFELLDEFRASRRSSKVRKGRGTGKQRGAKRIK